MAHRIWDVTGKRVGILANGREHGEAIAREAARCYVERHECQFAGVQHKAVPGVPLDDKELEPLLAGSDFLILTLGDTPELAERLIEDALVCERLDKPVLAIVTRPFEAVASATAGRHGVPDYPLIPIAPPTHDCNADGILERGLLVYRQGWATLTGIYKMTV